MIRRQIRVFGLSRSGLHPICHWLLCHFPDPRLFWNNMADPSRPPAPGQTYRVVGERYVPLEPGARVLRATAHLMLFEADGPARVEAVRAQGVAHAPRAAQVSDVLVLRDPFNLIASRLAMDRGGKVRCPTHEATMAVWKQTAAAFAGERPLPTGAVAINYNRWREDEAHRREVSAALGLSYSMRGLDTVPQFGRASSFDGHAFDGRAREMRTGSRWEAFRGDAVFRRLVSEDAEVRRLSRVVFGFDPLGD